MLAGCADPAHDLADAHCSTRRKDREQRAAVRGRHLNHRLVRLKLEESFSLRDRLFYSLKPA
jgi:hypothetical protein